MKMGAALLYTSSGMPLIWMGQEFGQTGPRMPNQPQPLDWSLLNNERNADLRRYYTRLTDLRKKTPALYSDTFEPIANLPDRAIIGYKRWDDQGGVVLVFANLKDQPAGQVTISGPGLPDGEWHDAIHDYDVHIQNHSLTDTFWESEVKIFTRSGTP